MSKPIARIPNDLRALRGLTIEDIERIVHLRKERVRLDARAARLEKDAKQARTDAAATLTEETEIVATVAPEPAKAE